MANKKPLKKRIIKITRKKPKKKEKPELRNKFDTIIERIKLKRWLIKPKKLT